MGDTLNNMCSGKVDTEIHGMIDGNAHINSAYTWPSTCGRVENGTFNLIKRTDIADIVKSVVTKYDYSKTEGVGKTLVDLNTKMYCGDANKKNIPSLIIASTMDTELAHLKGYDGIFIDDDKNKKYGSSTEFWDVQIKNTESVAVANPLRLFPLFSYDPRRYRRPSYYNPNNRQPHPYPVLVGQEGCGYWDDPFAHIVAHKHIESEIKKIWIGFSMNPSLGFRPFDECCECLPEFYTECVNNDIPILAHCAPEGMVTREANTGEYKTFNINMLNARLKKSEERCEKYCTSRYCGKQDVVKNNHLNYFYKNYGHPRNWIPVLEKYPKLHLCFSGFGGNSEWGHDDMSTWNKNDLASLPREWIRCIIKLTAKYDNVYTDVSGLDIRSDFDQSKSVRKRLKKILGLIRDNHNEFGHLKHKLVFGSGWYLTARDYGDYCSGFQELFCEVDNEANGKVERGELWEYVSLINPWNFYALHKTGKNKINEIHNTFAKNTSWNIDRDMLKEMKIKIFDTDPVEWYKDVGIIKYISNINTKRELKKPYVEVGDDLSVGHIGELITLEELYKINNRKDYMGYCEEYIDALNVILPRFEINTPRRLAHFLAQIIHESQRLSKTEEEFCYKTTEQLRIKFPTSFPVAMPNETIGKFLRLKREEWPKLANYVYSRSGNGLGNSLPDDGWNFRGRGLIQITGRYNYGICGKALGLGSTFEKNPNLLAECPYAVSSACWFWVSHGLNTLADNNDIDKITEKINKYTDQKSMVARKDNLKKAKEVLGEL